MAGLARTGYDKAYYNHALLKQFSCSERTRNRLVEILKNKKGGRLLDVGYGDGNLLRMASGYFDAYGIDVSEYAFQSLNSHFAGKVMLGDVAEADIGEGAYDVITAFNILEHIRSPQSAIKKIFHSLKPGGVFIGSVPNNFPVVGQVFTFCVNNFLDKTHVSTFKPSKWGLLFRESGFTGILFFWEFVLTSNMSFYMHKPFWKFFSHNLMFSARRS